jgi:PKD repeat protein
MVLALPATLVTDPVNGHYCQGTTGLKMKIENSVTGILYKLRKPLAGNGDLATITGNGGTVTFPGDFQSGTYITVPTTTSVSVIMDPQPAMFALTMVPANGKFCNYPEAAGVEIIIGGSQTGVEYSVFLGPIQQGPTWPGGGASYSFGSFNVPGVYTIKAQTISTGCVKNIGAVTIVANAPPTAAYNFQVVNPCSSTPVNFTSTTSGSGMSYLWNFDDTKSALKNTASVPNPSHLFEAWGNNTETFHVKFRVTDTKGCRDSIVKDVTVTQKPDATLTDIINPTNSSYPNTFAYCGANNVNPVGYFEFHNSSSTIASNSLYNITWGNCITNPTYISPTFANNIPATYTCLGEQSITYTINGQNGCNNTRQYGVFVGSNPGGGLTTPPNTYGIAPFLVNYIIPDPAYSNTPGTEYVYDFGDGSVITLYQEDLPVDRILPHTYETCSEIMIDGLYAYKAICTVTNPCGKIITTVFPIYVSCTAQGNFGGGGGNGGGAGWWPGDLNPDHIVGCNPVSFSNTTIPGFYIFPNGSSYTTNTVYQWNFGDPASAANNTSSLPNPIHIFTTNAQTYSVKLITYTGQNNTNNSGFDTIVKEIYIQTNPTANFEHDTTESCVPKYLQITDLSDVGGLGVPQYQWSVMPQLGWQIVTPGHEGDNTYPEPLIKFTAMGQPPTYTYDIKLTLINSCDTSIKIHPFMVCEPPEVAFAENEVFYCGPGPRSFIPGYDLNCDSATINILWQVTPSAGIVFGQGTSETSYAPIINFPDFGTYQVTVIIDNGCGSDTATQLAHITHLLSNNSIQAIPGEYCGCTAPIIIEGTFPLGGSGNYTYQWDVNPGTGWEPIPVAGTSQNYQIGSPLCENRLYRRTAYDAGDCSDLSNTAEIKIYPAVQNNLIFNDQSVCRGTQPAVLTGTVPFGGFSPFVYSWQQSTDGGISWNVIADASNPTYQPESVTLSTSFRRVATSAPCLPNFSIPINVTVCDPVSNNLISASASEVCAGMLPVLVEGNTPAGACGQLVYKWQKSDISPYTAFTTITGASTLNYQPYSLTNTTYFRRIVTSTALCSADTSNEVAFEVNPNPVAEAGLYAPIINGWTIVLAGTVSGGTQPYATHNWSPGDKISGDPNQQSVTTIPLAATSTFTYTVTDSKGCSGSDNTVVSVTGNPLACAITANPASVCPGCPSGQAHICLTVSGGSGNYTYSWSSSPSGFTSDQSCINVCPEVSTNYTCIVWDGSASCSQSTTIVVDPVPVITSQLVVNICSGEAVNYVPASTVNDATYSWSTIPGSCMGNSSGQGTGINDVLINAGITPCQVLYTITPHGPAPNFCAGTAVVLEVNVMPVAHISNTSTSQVVVSGQLTLPVTFTSDVEGAGFVWEFDNMTCPPFIATYLLNGNTAVMPVQVLSILPGGPSSCTLVYKVTPWVALPGGIQCFGNPSYYSFIINSEPVRHNLICPVPICTGQTATISLESSDIGINYQLYRGTVFVPPTRPGTGAQLDWTGISAAGSYTIKATNPSNAQSILMNGLCQVVINPLPQIFLLTALNGEHCSPVTPLLSGSQSGINYLLIKDGDINNPLQLKSGTGLPGFLVFDPVADSGLYIVNAINPITHCERMMQGSIHVDAALQQFVIYPGGILCEGDILCLEGSEPGINYQLWLNNQAFGTTVPGNPNGGAICFGSLTNAGTYRILAKDPLTNCEMFFDSSVVIHPLPASFTISPVQGCAGTNILLNSCQLGVKYYLFYTSGKGASTTKEASVAGPQICAGGILDFGPWYDEGVYRIKAVDTITNCSKWMTGTTTIYPEPEAYSLSPQGSACPPVEISLVHYEMNAAYYLYRNGDTLVSTDNGINGSVDFGIQTLPGVYSVRAQFVFAGGFECWKDMLGTITIYPAPVKFTLLPEGPLCAPARLFLNGSEAGVTYALWHNTYGLRQISTGNGGVLFFQAENQPGNYWVEAKSGDSCSSVMNGTVNVHPTPFVYHVVPSGQGLCEPTLIGLEGAESNTMYELLHQDGTSLTSPVFYTPTVQGSFWFANPQPAGNYVVRATNTFGCDTLMNGIAIVNALPVVDAGPLSDTICSPPSSSIFLSGSASNYSGILWSSPTNPAGNNFSSPNSLLTSYVFTANDLINKKITLTLTALGTGMCQGFLISDSITIHLLAPIIDAGIDQQICFDQTAHLNGLISGGATSGVWSSSGTGTFDNATSLSAIYFPGASDKAAGSVTLTLTSIDGAPCPNISNDMTLSIFNILTEGTISPNQTICFGEIPATLSATVPTGGSGIFSYQWEYSANAGTSWATVPSGGTMLSYSPGPLTGTTLYRIRQTDSYCNPVQTVYSNIVTVLVNNLTAGTIAMDQTVCPTQAATLTATLPSTLGSLSYQWQSSPDGNIFADVFGATLPEYTTGPLLTDIWYRRISISTLNSVSCSGISNVVKVTVNNLSPGMISAEQTLCENQTAILTGTLPTGDGTISYLWQSSPDGINFTDIPTAILQDYATNPISADTWFRRNAASTLNSVTCSIFSNIVKITVNNLTPGTIATDQTLCVNQTASLTGSLPVADGAITYQWQSSPDGSAFTDISGANLQNYNTLQLIVDTWYRCMETSTLNAVSCTYSSNSVKVTVNNLSSGTISSDQTICENQTASLTGILPSADGSISYQWQISADGSVFADIPGADMQNYTTTALSSDTWFSRITISTLNSVACSGTSNVVKVTVNNLTAGSVATGQVLCADQSASLTGSLPIADGAITFQWQMSTDSITFSNILTGSTSQNYTTDILTVDMWYRRIATSTVNSVSCQASSNFVKVTVNNLAAGTITAVTNICENQTASLSGTLPLSDGPVSFQWQSSADGSNFTDILGATTPDYITLPLVNDIWYRRIATSTLNAVSCSAMSNILKVTVNNIAAGTITMDQTICENQTANLSGTLASADGTVSYQWQSSPDGSVFTDIPTAILQEYTTSPISSDTWFRRIATSTLNSVPCSGFSNIVKITVNNLTPGTIATAQTLCVNQTASLSGSLPVADGAITYQWQSSTDGSAFADISGANLQNYNTLQLSADTWYRCMETSSLNAVSCTYASNSVMVTVNNLSSGTISMDQTICENQTASLTGILSSADGSVSYQWQYSADGSVFTDIPGSGLQNYTTTPLSSDAWYRRITISTLNSVACSGTSNVVKVTVNNITAGLVATNQVLCSNQTASLAGSLPLADGAITYQWQMSTDSITYSNILTGGTSQNYSTDILTADMWYRRVAFSTVNSVSCQAISNVVKVTVNNLAAGTISADQDICENQTATLTGTLSPSDGTIAFQWQSSADGSLFADILGATLQDYTTILLANDAWYRRIATSTLNSVSCSGISNIVKVTVINFTAGTIEVDHPTICENYTAILSGTLPSADGTISYQWQASPDGNIFANIPGATMQNYTTNPLLNDAWYRRIAISTLNFVSCSGSGNIVKVTVNNLTAGSIAADQTICGNQSASLAGTLPFADGAISYQWQSGPDGSTFTDIPGAILQNYTSGLLIVDTWYRRVTTSTLNSVSCFIPSNDMKVTVNNLDVGIISMDQTICENQVVTLTGTLPSADGTITYQWQSSSDGSIFSEIPGAVLQNYTSLPVGADTWYRRLAISTLNTVSCQGTSNIVKVSVNNLTGGTISAEQTICFDQVASVSGTLPLSDGAISYQWQSSPDGIAFIDIPGAALQNYTSVPLSANTWYHRTSISTLNGVACSKVSNTVSIIVNDPLVSGTAGPDQSICYGGVPLTLTSVNPTGGSGIFSSQWQLKVATGSWSNIVGAIYPTYSPSNLFATTYFRMIQTDSYCDPDQVVYTDSVTVRVETPTVNAGPNDTICGLAPYVLSQASSAYAVNYTWSTSGTGAFTGQYQLHPTYFPSPADMNTGSVVLTLTTSDRCGNAVSNHMTLTLGQLPVAFFSLGEPTCSNTKVYLTDQSSVSNGYIKMWVWDYGDGTNDTIRFPNIPNVQHTYIAPGTSFMVKLTVHTSLGCTDNYQRIISTVQAPVANFYFSQVRCDNQPVQFTNASQLNGAFGLQPWSWDFGDPTTGTSNFSNQIDPTHQFSGSGPFTVRLIVLNNNNCMDTIVKVIDINAHPPLAFSYTVNCLNEAVYFSPVPSITNVNAIGSWYWDFGDGVNSHLQNTPHVFMAPGTYVVSLTATDTIGCETTVSQNVTISPLPIAHFDAGASNCAASTVHFNELTSSSIGYVVKWVWDFGDGNQQTVVHPDDPNVSHLYANSGSYNVSLMVQSSDSCTNSETQAIIIDPKPMANFDFGSACDSLYVPFTDLTQNNGGGNIVQWHWDFGDQMTGINNISSFQNPSHVFSASGLFTVVLVATTANGCSDTVTRQVTVKGKPPVGFTTQNNCQNNDVLFLPAAIMNIPSIASWNWTFGDGATSTLQSPSHPYNNTGDYIVTLTVADISGCVNMVARTVSIHPQPIANFDFSQPACRESAIQFTSLASVSTGFIVKWTWNFGDGNTTVVTNIGNPNVSHAYANYGNFNVTLTVKTNDSCSVSFSKPVVIIPNPLADFSYQPACMNSPVQFNSLSQAGSGAISNWDWNFGDPASGSVNSSTLQDPAHQYNSTVAYNVTLIVTNNGGCKDTISKPVTVHPLTAVDFSWSSQCSGDTSHFVSTVSAGAVAGRIWDFGDGNSSTAINPDHIYATTGIYDVTLSITDTAGCMNTKTHPVSISLPPVALFQVAQPNCTTSPVFFDEMSALSYGSFASWHWTFGDGHDTLVVAPANPDIHHSYAAAGSFVVTLKAITAQGCEDEFVQQIAITSGPLAEFSFGNTCAGESVSFTNLAAANGGTMILNYNWNFGDPSSGINNSSNLANPSHVYAFGSTYQVSLIVVNASGCNDTVSHPVIIRAKPPVDYAWLNTCLGSSTQFTVNPTVTNINAVQLFEWDFGDGSGSALQAPAHTFATNGTYNVVLTITDTAGCSNSKSYPVVISPMPVAMYSYSSNCNNAAVQFADLSYIVGAAPIVGWHWDFGVPLLPNDTSNLQNPSWPYTSTGTYTVSLRVTSLGGCQDSIAIPVKVFAKPAASFNFTTNCVDGAVYFQDSSYSPQSSVISWYWEFEPFQFSTEQHPLHVYYENDKWYDVKHIITDVRGCSDTITKQVYVPAPLKATFDYSSTCFMDATSFSPLLQAPAGDSLVFFKWDFDDESSGVLNVSTQKYPLHIFTKAGLFKVSMQATDIHNCTYSMVKDVIVQPLPTATFTYQEGVCDSLITFGKPVPVNGSNIVSWFWEFGDGSDSLIENTPYPVALQHKYPDVGFYTVKLTVKNSDSCANTMVTSGVWVKPCMQAMFGLADTLICQNNSFAFADSSVSGIPVTQWEWDFGDGDSLTYTSYRQNVNHTYATTGHYSVKMRILSSVAGNSVTDSVQMAIFVKPAPVADFMALSNKFCFGGMASFTNESHESGSEVRSWKWDFGEPSIQSDTSVLRNPVDYQYSKFGDFMVRLIAENDFGCIDTVLKPVTVLRLPFVDFKPLDACAGQLTTFDDKSIGYDTAIVAWDWTIKDSVSGFVSYQSSQDASYTFEDSGNLLISLNARDANGCRDSIVKPVTIYNKPVSAFNYTENIDGVQGQVQFINNSSGATNFVWDFDNGDLNTHEMPPMTTFTENRDYVIRLVASENSSSCSDTASLVYKLVFKGLFVPNAFSPNNPIEAIRLLKPVGIGIAEYLFEVYDKWGNMIWSSDSLDVNGSPLSGWDGTYRGEDMPIGVYVWKASAVFRDGTIWKAEDLGKLDERLKYKFGTATLIR